MNTRDLPRHAWMPLTRLTLSRPSMSTEALIAWVSVYFVLACNTVFWSEVQRAGAPLGLRLSLAVAVFALHACLLGLFAWGRIAQPLLSVLLVITAFVTWSMGHYAVVFDVDMIVNVLQTDQTESRELLSTGLLLHVLFSGVVPACVLQAVRVTDKSMQRVIRDRLWFVLAMLLLATLAIGSSSQSIFALMRSDHALRYRITPGNYLVSLGRALTAEEALPGGEKRAIATDAERAPESVLRRPRLLVLVVGETVRADHWGLNGAARQTTPVLAARSDVINFPDVTACGTSTAVSLPCMFSLFGRSDYDRAAILSHESVLDVLSRTGVGVLWRDNQAGCKGVCDGVETEQLSAADAPSLCRAGRCLDEILLQGLSARLRATDGDLLIVLHQLGNHGPNYFERYPDAFERFQPTCRTAELGRCSREEIANAYDNALLYTDTLLGRLIDLLAAQTHHDAAMLYVADHGESLGEYGLYLHGAPYALAPKAQLHVPMTMWMSPSLSAGLGVGMGCLAETARQPHSHDNLFHSMLGMFDVSTRAYRPERDMLRACREVGPGPSKA